MKEADSLKVLTIFIRDNFEEGNSMEMDLKEQNNISMLDNLKMVRGMDEESWKWIMDKLLKVLLETDS